MDLLITNSPNFVIKSKTRTSNTISDHELVYLLANIRIPRSAPQTIRVRNFRAIDSLRLQADFQTRDLQPFYAAVNPSTKADLFTAEFNDLLQHHAPERTVVVRDKRTPWISEGIKQAVALRDMSYALYSRNPNRTRDDNQWQDYVRKRDRANSLIFAAKKRYAEQHFDHSLPAKKLWCNLRREGVHNNAKNNSPVEGIDADELNHFFSDGHHQLQNVNYGRTSTVALHRTAIDHGAAELNFRHTTSDEICHKIHEIQTNSTGTDGIPISFIKLLCPFFLPHLSHLFNSIIEDKSFPRTGRNQSSTPFQSSRIPLSLRTSDQSAFCLQFRRCWRKYCFLKSQNTSTIRPHPCWLGINPATEKGIVQPLRSQRLCMMCTQISTMIVVPSWSL